MSSLILKLLQATEQPTMIQEQVIINNENNVQNVFSLYKPSNNKPLLAQSNITEQVNQLLLTNIWKDVKLSPTMFFMIFVINISPILQRAIIILIFPLFLIFLLNKKGMSLFYTSVSDPNLEINNDYFFEYVIHSLYFIFYQSDRNRDERFIKNDIKEFINNVVEQVQASLANHPINNNNYDSAINEFKSILVHDFGAKYQNKFGVNIPKDQQEIFSNNLNKLIEIFKRKIVYISHNLNSEATKRLVLSLANFKKGFIIDLIHQEIIRRISDFQLDKQKFSIITFDIIEEYLGGQKNHILNFQRDSLKSEHITTYYNDLIQKSENASISKDLLEIIFKYYKDKFLQGTPYESYNIGKQNNGNIKLSDIQNQLFDDLYTEVLNKIQTDNLKVRNQGEEKNIENLFKNNKIDSKTSDSAINDIDKMFKNKIEANTEILKKQEKNFKTTFNTHKNKIIDTIKTYKDQHTKETDKDKKLVKDLTKKINDIDAQINKKVSNYSSINNDITNKTSKKNGLIAEIDNLNTEKTKSEGIVTRGKETLSIKQKNLKDANENLKTLNLELSRLKSLNKTIQQNNKQDITTCNNNIQQQKNKIATIESAIKKLEQDIKNNTKIIDNIPKEIEKKQDEVNTLTKQIDQLNTNNNKIEQEIAELQNQKRPQQDELNHAQASLTDKQTKYNELQNLLSEIENMSIQDQNNNNIISKIIQKYPNALTRDIIINSIRRDIKDCENNITQYQINSDKINTYKKHQVNISEYIDQVKKIKNTKTWIKIIKNIKTKCHDLHESINTFKNKYRNMNTELYKEKKTLEEFIKYIDELNQYRDSIDVLFNKMKEFYKESDEHKEMSGKKTTNDDNIRIFKEDCISNKKEFISFLQYINTINKGAKFKEDGFKNQIFQSYKIILTIKEMNSRHWINEFLQVRNSAGLLTIDEFKYETLYKSLISQIITSIEKITNNIFLEDNNQTPSSISLEGKTILEYFSEDNTGMKKLQETLLTQINKLKPIIENDVIKKYKIDGENDFLPDAGIDNILKKTTTTPDENNRFMSNGKQFITILQIFLFFSVFFSGLSHLQKIAVNNLAPVILTEWMHRMLNVIGTINHNHLKSKATISIENLIYESKKNLESSVENIVGSTLNSKRSKIIISYILFLALYIVSKTLQPFFKSSFIEIKFGSIVGQSIMILICLFFQEWERKYQNQLDLLTLESDILLRKNNYAFYEIKNKEKLPILFKIKILSFLCLIVNILFYIFISMSYAKFTQSNDDNKNKITIGFVFDFLQIIIDCFRHASSLRYDDASKTLIFNRAEYMHILVCTLFFLGLQVFMSYLSSTLKDENLHDLSIGNLLSNFQFNESLIDNDDVKYTPICASLNLSETKYHINAKPIVSNITYNMNITQHIMCVGPSGAGKSTLKNLVSDALGFEQPLNQVKWIVLDDNKNLKIFDSTNLGFNTMYKSGFFITVPQMLEILPEVSLKLMAALALPEGEMSNTNLFKEILNIFHVIKEIKYDINIQYKALSGGQAQRTFLSIEIAKAIFANHRGMFVLDESYARLHEHLRHVWNTCVTTFERFFSIYSNKFFGLSPNISHFTSTNIMKNSLSGRLSLQSILNPDENICYQLELMFDTSSNGTLSITHLPQEAVRTNISECIEVSNGTSNKVNQIHKVMIERYNKQINNILDELNKYEQSQLIH